MYDSVISTRITRLYGFQPSSVVLCIQNSVLWPQLLVSMYPRPHLWFSVCKTVCLASELQVPLGPRPHLWFLHAKQRLMDRNNKSLRVPDITCRFMHAKQRDLHQNDKSIWVPALICFFFMQNSEFMTRLTSLYVAQTSSVVFACKPATFGPKLHVSMGPRTHLWFSACKTPCLASELLVSMGPSPHLWFLHSKQRLLEPNNKSLRVPDITCRFVQAIQRD